MPIEVATHSGSYHADDVLALALIRAFLDRDATVVRTRDLDRIREADIAIDVGGEYDPDRGRFDHHQASYTGDRSSAGLVLDWLEGTGKVTAPVARALRRELIDYVDAVDNGRTSPVLGIPCFATIVAVSNHTAETEPQFLHNYLEAVAIGERFIAGVVAGCEQVAAARTAVVAAMDAAEADGRAVLFLDEHLHWKTPYFENGGEDHPTDYVLLPADGKWRIVAIPPEPGSFANKRSLPEEWAGLVDGDLSAVVGVAGAAFCHKNRFIAVFETREGAVEALESWQLMRRAGSDSRPA